MRQAATALGSLVALAAALAMGRWIARGGAARFLARRPGLLRALAAAILFLEAGRRDARAQEPALPPAPGGEAPGIPDPLLRDETIRAWRAMASDLAAAFRFAETPRAGEEVEARQTLRDRIDMLPPLFDEAIAPALLANAGLADEPLAAPAAAAILSWLDGLEGAGCIHPGIAGALWRRSASLPEGDRARLPEVLGRISRHARMADALTAASFGISPYAPRAWMSKAGPQREEIVAENEAVATIRAALPLAWAAAADSAWATDGRARLTLAGDFPVALHRDGTRLPVMPGATFEFRRLDALEIPPTAAPSDRSEGAIVRHSWIGPIPLPAGRFLCVWDFPALLPLESRAAVDAAVRDALAGDEAAAERIETALPLCHAPLREALIASPDSPGAPRLRTILALYDR